MVELVPLDAREEACRLEALRGYAILDTPPERQFDDVVRLAARLCRVPISTITLIDADRQWFKARVGLGIDQTPRAIAFCSHAIQSAEPFVIEDARLDPRFSHNPLVTGEPHLVFYAGFPLVSQDGCAVGTLTVMDRVPRQLTEDQYFALQVLADQVTAQLELRRSLAENTKAHTALVRAQADLEARVQARTQELADACLAQRQLERLYQALWETTTDAILILDEDSLITYANPSVANVFGHQARDLIGKPIAILQPEALRPLHQAGLRRFLQTGTRHVDWRATETTALRADGTEVPIEIAFSEFRLEGRRSFVGFIRDISGRKRTESALVEEKEKAEAILRAVADAVIACDREGRVSFLNPMAERLTGWANAEGAGRPLEDVVPLMDEVRGSPLPLLDLLTQALHSGPVALPSTAVLTTRNGRFVSVEGCISRLRPSRPEPHGWVLALRDVSLARELAARISYQASHDPLTNLLNRAEFDHRLRSALATAAAEQRHYSLLYLDLDQFKIVNDTLGHAAGDELLKQLATVLVAQVRGSDCIGRLGGDEFAILLENCSAEDAVRIAEKVRQAVGEFVFTWEGKVFPTTVSIGHVHFADHTLTLAEVLSRADEACYAAKDQGRNRVHTYWPDDELLARRHGDMEWVGLIRHALDEDRFVLYSQPVFSLKDAASSAASSHREILLRMRDKNGVLVSPTAFIPAAERYDLMPVLDRWVIRAVLRHIAQRAADIDDGTWYAINLSGTTISKADLWPFIREQLDASQVDPRRLCFEITETAAIAQLTSAAALLGELRAIGCKVALDDFGSGMSSFSYLKQLPVDYIKIDGSFVRNIIQDPIDRAMVESIAQVAHVMGLRTIAECVESKELLPHLQALGVDYGQGFGLGMPEPLDGAPGA